MQVTVKNKFKNNNGYIAVCEVNMGTYATGGEAFDKSKLGMEVVQCVIPSPASGYVFEYDHANNKIKAYYPTASHTHTENIDASYTQNATTAANTAGAAQEVANGTDLSSVTLHLVVFGY
jgi:hypothetical protein